MADFVHSQGLCRSLMLETAATTTTTQCLQQTSSRSVAVMAAFVINSQGLCCSLMLETAATTTTTPPARC